MPLSNLQLLMQDMKNKKWTICSFLFSYKKIEYIVLVKRFVAGEKYIEGALVKLHFMKSDNLSDDLEVGANSRKLMIGAQMLREYFGIEWSNNLGCILKQFSEQLGKAIPVNMPNKPSEVEKKAMVRSLSKSDSEDPNKIYCNKIRRNPNGGRRSEFNSDKTKLLRPLLFEKFKNDNSISFCYSDEKSMENDDVTIIRNFSKKIK